MPGTTTGQTALATIVDADDTEQALTVTLTSALQALANLFESATGHDHSGAGKGKPIGTAGLASGITLTSPHMTTPVVDSGGLTVTAGGLTVTAGNLVLGAGSGAGLVRLPNNQSINWRNAGNTNDHSIIATASDNIDVLINGATQARVSSSPGSAQSTLTIMVNDGALTTLRQVVVGAADSGGTGFRLLRVTN